LCQLETRAGENAKEAGSAGKLIAVHLCNGKGIEYETAGLEGEL